MNPRTKRISALYVSTLLIYGLALLILHHVPYFERTIPPSTQEILLYLYITYAVLALPTYLFRVTPYSTNKPFLALKGITSFLFQQRMKKEERNAWLFLLVKFYFLPLMITFFSNNIHSLLNQKSFAWYPFLLTIIFTIDTFVFAIGYSIETRSLRNVVKSVEPTFFGWFVALICYPPFNSIVGRFIPWGANDYVFFWNPTLTVLFQIIIIGLLGIYLWATFALGFKASNLTNRGIVTKFPYSVVRHPAYISKNLVWWITLLPIINWQLALGMAFWSCIYFLRAYTEERHLSLDKDYLEYKKKVKRKFIPRLFSRS